ncbi:MULTISPECIES: hypothetical protein [unclassified Pseudoxanthomonas]|uniref:hypothetical protein n=1 Tax=unclassified Pseudoxanthomonas TaxID=2645906 RepID=UPI00161752BD|nr:MULTISPECIES: hypothetical protein [unclassified Pseudoxanthomonas]MBB3277902.1 hypothetical protein [Pseudoxanthomonas sp. OG2]MBV7474573.1 hypothetical protein [Pseudoxanthomonas sp. PXM05]
MTRTNAYTLLCVAIRAVVVWFSASLLLMTPGLMIAMRDGTYQGDAIWLGLAAILLPALVPGLAWLFADKLTRLALARPQESVFESRIPCTAGVMADWKRRSPLRTESSLRCYAVLVTVCKFPVAQAVSVIGL